METPTYQFASLMPVPVSDYMHYQFYQTCPPSCLFVAYPLPVRSFDLESAEKALEGLPRALDFLVKRGVDRITFAGLPIAGVLGRERCLEMMAAAEEKTGIPFSFDAEEAADGLRRMNARTIAVAAKWPAEIMARIAAYMRHAGFEVAGFSSDSFAAKDVIGVAPAGGSSLATSLAEKALDGHAEVDALLLGGGAWLSLPTILDIEARYDKPVVSNTVATSWAAMRQVRVAPRSPGLGRLLDSLIGEIA